MEERILFGCYVCLKTYRNIIQLMRYFDERPVRNELFITRRLTCNCEEQIASEGNWVVVARSEDLQEWRVCGPTAVEVVGVLWKVEEVQVSFPENLSAASIKTYLKNFLDQPAFAK